MKLRVIVFSLILATNALCSWPDDTLSAAAIASNTKEKLSQFLEKADEVYATASDYRGLTLKLNRKTNQWDCSVPVGYYEVHSWLSDSWVDTEKAGWTRRPSNGLENAQSNLDSLLGVLDEAKIEARRVSTVRNVGETKDLRAVWNKLEFSIPTDQVDTLYAFLRDIYSDYRPDTQVHIYTKRHVEKQGSSLPAPEKLVSEAFLGLRDKESKKVGDSNPESALAEITSITTVSVSDYAAYQKALQGGRIKAHAMREGYIYYAIEERRDCPFPDGSSTWVDVTERYKAKIPEPKSE